MKETILIVDDSNFNRVLLDKILGIDYIVLHAQNGNEALEIIQAKYTDLSAVVLDLVMPVMDGKELLNILRKDERYQNLPILIATGEHDEKLESECLQLGAWDFITKPYNPIALQLRLRNIIGRSQMYLMRQVQELAERDILTGLYNRRYFMNKTERMLHTLEDKQFVLVHMDVDNFRLYNASFGSSTGDVLLREMADILISMRRDHGIEDCTYGRVESDVFCICLPFEKDRIEELILEAEEKVQGLCSTYRLKISFGLYVIDDPYQDMEEMYSHTVEAAKKCKKNLNVYYAYYDQQMSEKEKQAQKYTNGLDQAIHNREFQVYLQPKYSIDTDRPCGAEALVRWQHPQWGMVMPGQFIPVFEQNGLIMQLDYYMWESVCMLMSGWKKQGRDMYPVSVNISRASMYNPQLVEQIDELTIRYGIPKHLLNLEITESAYMSNPDLMKEMIEQLRKLGFVIMMDDFGSGYSSLNTLKDIDVDILKIDMKFLPTGQNNAKSEKILASIARMAGWLGIPVVVEGVETLEQKEFLESIGCTYVQGYYYAKPMPVADYEKLMEEQQPIHTTHRDNPEELLHDFDAIWSSDSQSGTLLKSVSVPFCIMEYVESQMDILRVNQSFRDLFGSGSLEHFLIHKEEYKLLSALDEAVLNKAGSECECLFIMNNGQSLWQRIRLNYIGTVGQIHLISATFADVFTERFLERELNSVFHALHNTSTPQDSILIIDDLAISREILNDLFEDEYKILQAADGQEGLALLKEHTEEIAAILLDMMMPNMDGQEFLSYKNKMPSAAEIPVIVISTEDSEETQVHMLENGVNDYITKPFIPAVVKKRFNNVLEYSSRFRTLVHEYHQAGTIEQIREPGNLTGFTIPELYTYLSFMNHVFERVRIVDPQETSVITISEDGHIERAPYSCFVVWNQAVRCENCSSLCAMRNGSTVNKFEMLDNELYYIVSKPIQLRLNQDVDEYLVMEIISKVSDETRMMIPETRKAYEVLGNTHNMLYTDPLTGAYNRRYLEELLFLVHGQNEVAHKVSLILMDIRGFREINHLLGRQVGDRVLKEFVHTLQKKIRDNDSFIRLGGDEFVIILTDCSKEQMIASIKRLQEAIETIHYGPNDTMVLQADFGYAYRENFQEKEGMLEEMIKEAEQLFRRK